MVFTTLYRSLLTRLIAAFIVVLVVSPYSEPFATMSGTDFGGAGAVDVGGSGGAKFKTSTDDALAPPMTMAATVLDVVHAERPVVTFVARDSRQSRRVVLRI
jgi:hypothetical protein